jgi:hypothetical protein
VSAGAGDGGSSFTLCQLPPGNLYLISSNLAQRPIRVSQWLQRCCIRLRCVFSRRSAHGKGVSMRHRAACSSAAEASASRIVVPGCPTEFAVKYVGVMTVKQYTSRHITRGVAPASAPELSSQSRSSHAQTRGESNDSWSSSAGGKCSRRAAWQVLERSRARIPAESAAAAALGTEPACSGARVAAAGASAGHGRRAQQRPGGKGKTAPG